MLLAARALTLIADRDLGGGKLSRTVLWQCSRAIMWETDRGGRHAVDVVVVSVWVCVAIVAGNNMGTAYSFSSLLNECAFDLHSGKGKKEQGHCFCLIWIRCLCLCLNSTVYNRVWYITISYALIHVWPSCLLRRTRGLHPQLFASDMKCFVMEWLDNVHCTLTSVAFEANGYQRCSNQK